MYIAWEPLNTLQLTKELESWLWRWLESKMIDDVETDVFTNSSGMILEWPFLLTV